MALLDPVLNPLLGLPVFWIVFIMSLSVSLLITFIYKLTTNQNLMKQLKDELKELQKEMKELKDKPEEMMKVQQKAMKTNMKYMGHSMRSTLVTFIPIIIIFGWMNAHLGYAALMPNEEFTATVEFDKISGGNITIDVPQDVTLISDRMRLQDSKDISWIMKADEGEYNLEFSYNGEKYEKPVIVTYGRDYYDPVKDINDNNIEEIRINNEKQIVLNLFGWKIGWLGSYIILSIIFIMLLIKIFKVY
jgi:hypothetical protein